MVLPNSKMEPHLSLASIWSLKGKRLLVIRANVCGERHWEVNCRFLVVILLGLFMLSVHSLNIVILLGTAAVVNLPCVL